MAGFPVIETLNLDNLRFDNVSHYLTTTTCPANDSKYVFSGDFTIEAWINMTTLPAVGSWKPIINSDRVWPFSRSFYFGIMRDPGGLLALIYQTSTDGINWVNTNLYSAVVIAPFNFQTSTWYHVAVCRTGNTCNLFINGYLVGQNTSFTYTNFAGTSPVQIGCDGQVTAFFNGYISNLRVVKGAAVYTAASTAGTTYYANSTVSYTNPNQDLTRSFIPPTVDLTATQSAGSGGSNINAIGGNTTVNTSLLVCQSTSSGSYTAAFVDNSSYAQVINPVGYIPNVSRVASPTLPYPGYFSTTFAAGALTTSVTSAGFAFGTGDFTVEGWIYPTSLVSGAGIIGSWTGTAATSNWIVTMGVTNTSALRLITCNAGTTINAAVESSAGALVVNVWQHIAVVRISGSISMYVNGVRVYGPVANTTNFSVTQTCQMGAVNTLAPFFVGSMSNMRVTKGTGIYTGNFTPQLTPLANTVSTTATNTVNVATAVAGTSGVQLLACRYRTLTPEYSINGFTLNTGGTAPTVNANTVPQYIPTDNNLLSILQQPKTNDVGPNFLTIPGNANFNLGTGAFTIEGWFNPTAYSVAPNLIASYPTNGTGVGSWKLGLTASGFLTLNYDGATAVTTTTQALVAGVWSHVAVTRSATGVYAFYVNGVAATGTVTSQLQFGNTAAALWVGSQEYTGPTATFTGLSNNIRITRGIAVYTGAFTPPSANLGTTQASGTNIAAIASSANVGLLIQANSSGGIQDVSPTAATISVYGNPQSNTYGTLTTTSNSVYNTSPNTLRIQYTAPNSVLVNKYKTAYYDDTHSEVETMVSKVASSDMSSIKRNMPHLLNSASIPATLIRLQYTSSNDIPVNEFKVVQNTLDQSSIKYIPRILSLRSFDNPIGTNLTKQPSTSYQFWS